MHLFLVYPTDFFLYFQSRMRLHSLFFGRQKSNLAAIQSEISVFNLIGSQRGRCVLFIMRLQISQFLFSVELREGLRDKFKDVDCKRDSLSHGVYCHFNKGRVRCFYSLVSAKAYDAPDSLSWNQITRGNPRALLQATLAATQKSLQEHISNRIATP